MGEDSKQIKITPGTSSLARANLAKHLYYNDDKSFLNIVEMLICFDQDGTNTKNFNDFKSKLSHKNHVSSMISLSDKGEIYFSIQEKNNMHKEKMEYELALDTLKTQLINFVIVTMERKKVLEAEYTPLTLKRLPLTLGGLRPDMYEGMEEEGLDEY